MPRYLMVVYAAAIIAAALVYWLPRSPPANARSIAEAVTASTTTAVSPASASAAPASSSTANSTARSPTPAHLAPLPPGVMEFHGELGGQQVWMRLKAVSATSAYRLAYLLWTPPAPETIDGTQVSDCPFIALDDHGLLVAMDGRRQATEITPLTASGGYRITREVHRGSGVEARLETPTTLVRGVRRWERRWLPLHLALSWRAGSSGEVPLLDAFNPRSTGQQSRVGWVRWNDADITVDNQHWRAEADQYGRLLRLTDVAAGVAATPVLVIREWRSAP